MENKPQATLLPKWAGIFIGSILGTLLFIFLIWPVISFPKARKPVDPRHEIHSYVCTFKVIELEGDTVEYSVPFVGNSYYQASTSHIGHADITYVKIRPGIARNPADQNLMESVNMSLRGKVIDIQVFDRGIFRRNIPENFSE